MKTCPLLWRQPEAPATGLLEKSVDLDGSTSSRGRKKTASGLHLECLGAVCRFHDEDTCLIERLGRIVSGEEIAEGLHLATATLTDEIRSALDCTAGPLRTIEQRLEALPSESAPAAAGAEDWQSAVDQRLTELAERMAEWREGAATQIGDLAGTLATATTDIGTALRELRAEMTTERERRQEDARAGEEWRQAVQRDAQNTEERWESMVLSLTELSERMESSLDVIREHITLEQEQRARSDRESQLAEAKRENNSGVVFYHQGDLERAAERFRKAIELAPEFVEAYNNLGLVATELDHAEEATKHFQRAIELDPSLSASYNNLGYVFFLQENFEEAIAMYQEAIERASNGSAAWTNLGNAHFKLGDLDKAREAWETAVELDPGNRKAAENLARLLQETPA